MTGLLLTGSRNASLASSRVGSADIPAPFNDRPIKTICDEETADLQSQITDLKQCLDKDLTRKPELSLIGEGLKAIKRYIEDNIISPTELVENAVKSLYSDVNTLLKGGASLKQQ